MNATNVGTITTMLAAAEEKSDRQFSTVARDAKRLLLSEIFEELARTAR